MYKYTNILSKIKTNNILLFIFSFVILFLSYGYNITNIGYPANTDNQSQFVSFQSESEALFLARIDAITKKNTENTGGFLIIDNRLPNYAQGPYTSQVGLQGIILSFFAPKNIDDLPNFYQLSRYIFSGLTVTIFCFLIISVNKTFGKITSSILLGLLAYSTWIIFFAKNLYWVTPLLILPLIGSWVLYPYFHKEKKIYLFYFLISFFIFLKALCGYEYVTNIILSPIVPIIYFSLENRDPIRKILNSCIKIISFGLIGFLSAIFIHIVQLSIYFHSFSQSIYTILDRIKVRTYVQNNSSDSIYLLVHTKNIFQILEGYLLRPIFGDSKFLNPIYLDSISIKRPDISFHNLYQLLPTLGGIIVIAIILLLILFIINKNNSDEYRKLKNLSFSLMVSVIISFSWAISAKGHMYFHNHFNQIIFYIPFVITFCIFIGYYIQVIFNIINIKKN